MLAVRWNKSPSADAGMSLHFIWRSRTCVKDVPPRLAAASNLCLQADSATCLIFSNYFRYCKIQASKVLFHVLHGSSLYVLHIIGVTTEMHLQEKQWCLTGSYVWMTSTWRTDRTLRRVHTISLNCGRCLNFGHEGIETVLCRHFISQHLFDFNSHVWLLSYLKLSKQWMD